MDAVRELEDVVREMVAVYERLEVLAEARRRALAGADRAAIARCVAEEGELIAGLTELEARRAGASARVGKQLGVAGEAQLRIGAIASRVGGESGERLAGLASRLRDRIESVTRINAVCRAAAESLSKHMEGLWRRVLDEVQGGGVYGASGRMQTSSAVVSGIDVRS